MIKGDVLSPFLFLIYNKKWNIVDFINNAIEWIKGIFSKSGNGSSSKYVPPEYPKAPYNKRNQPDLNDIPESLARFILRWFVSSGMSLEGASATAGNIWRESFFNPTQLQIVSGKPSGPGRGLAQWTDSTLTKRTADDGKQRWDHYEKKFFPVLKNSHEFWKNSKPSDLEPQLAYIIYEMKEDFPGVWRNMESEGSVSQKTIDVLKKYEISKDRDNKEEQNFRSKLAEEIYKIGKKDKKINDMIAKRKEGT